MFCYRGCEHEIYLLIAAAGSSSRMGAAAGGANKVYADLNGAPVLFHSLDKFDRMSFIDAAVAVIAQRDEAAFDSMMKSAPEYLVRARGAKPLNMPVHKTPGGMVRSESVLNGLLKISSLVRNPVNAAVVIHDGARPNFSEAAFKAAAEAYFEAFAGGGRYAGLVMASPSYDTLCRVDAAGFIRGYEDRDKIYKVVTPQIFNLKILLECFDRHLKTAGSAPAAFTDESSLAVHFGYEVKIFKSPSDNLKITTVEDLEYLKAVIK